MNSKIATYSIIVVSGLVALGSIGFAILDGCRSHTRIVACEEAVQRDRKALEKAKAAVHEILREELRKREAALEKEKGAEAVRRQKALAKKRRVATLRRFFGSDGFKLTSSYMRACRMPEGELSAEDQEIVDLAGELLCETDLETAADVTEAALKSKDPRARLAAVEMLSAMGDVGLADLGEFLSDSHPEVANLAADRWELGVQDVVHDVERTALVKVGLLAITDADQLQSMVGTLQMTSDESLIIRTVEDVIRDGSKAQRDAVKVAYENLTGEPWKDEATAEAWLKENYTPPEPEEPSEPEDESETDIEEDSEI